MLSNLYYVQHLMGTLPVNYARYLRKLSFQHQQSVHHISVMNLLFSVTASKEFELLCVRTTLLFSLSLIDRFVLVCGMWQAFVCHLASF